MIYIWKGVLTYRFSYRRSSSAMHDQLQDVKAAQDISDIPMEGNGGDDGFGLWTEVPIFKSHWLTNGLVLQTLPILKMIASTTIPIISYTPNFWMTSSRRGINGGRDWYWTSGGWGWCWTLGVRELGIAFFGGSRGSLTPAEIIRIRNLNRCTRSSGTGPNQLRITAWSVYEDGISFRRPWSLIKHI